jgi:ADP-dependent phosphofructokinase/glucokinase
MSRLGVPSTVHLVSIDDHVRRLLPAEVSYLCSAAADSTDPHLIVQYPAGTRIRVGAQELRAPHANRLIYVNDRPNRELALSPGLGAALSTAGVFLISGFNSMQDPLLLDLRLQELRAHLGRLPASAVVVYEDAGFHVPGFSRRVRDGILDLVDVYGLNEDELGGHVGYAPDLLDATTMAGALRDLRADVPARTLVVHTHWWALALGADAGRYRSALAAGTAVAGARYVHGDAFTEADYLEALAGPGNERGAAFARRLERLLPGEVCCVPSLRLAAPTPTTVGLGDSFVGGFIAALSQAPLRTPRPA